MRDTVLSHACLSRKTVQRFCGTGMLKQAAEARHPEPD